MSPSSKSGLAVLVATCLLASTCIPYEDAREEFCENADPARQQSICGTEDGGTRPDGGTLADAGTPPDSGVTVDAGTDAGTPSCFSSSDCPLQPGPCLESAASCVEGKCVYALREDGTPCSGTPETQCRASTGTCSKGVCQLPLRTSGACDDGNACTDNDTCSSAGTCVGTPRVCNQPPTACHQPSGTCNNGTCSYAFKPSDAACDDGNSCTDNDTCNGAGTCAGIARICNQPPSTCHNPTGTCSSGTCNYTLKPANSACNDGNACTDNDVCNSSGVCSGVTRTCTTPPSQCHEPTGTCSNGACTYGPKPANSTCTDDNKCTEGDVCNGSGTCVPGTECQDRSDECLDFVGCSPTSGCQYTYRCSGTEECNFGVCCPPRGICVPQ